MRIICIMMLYRLTRGRRREEEEEEEELEKKKLLQQRHANCMRDNWVLSRDFWGRRFRNLVGEIAMLYAVSLSLLRDRDATYLRIWQGSADGNSLSLSCTGTTNGLNDLGLGSLVGPMGTFPLDTFEKYPWEPPGPST